MMETDLDKKGDKKKISNLLSPFKNLKKAKKRKTREEKTPPIFEMLLKGRTGRPKVGI